MKRWAEDFLSHWYHKKGRVPLVLRGARQVGKSTLVRLFCANNHLDLIEVNLEIRRIRSIHAEQLNMADVLDEIQLLTHKTVGPKSVLFIDEIQQDPKMIQILRYFFESYPNLPVIAAGSLLEIALRDSEFSFPVGRIEFYNLGPMTFTEFLAACGEDLLLERLKSLNLSAPVHQKATDLFRKFLYIGGMPRAVFNYIENRSLVEVRSVQDQLIQTYMADFPKYNKRIDAQRVIRIFESAVAQVGKKVIYQSFDRESKSRDIRRIIELLIDARVLTPCYHAEASGIPLSATVDLSVYKIYMVDVGLMNSMHRLDLHTIEDHIAARFVTKGVIAEQFVAQHLAYSSGRHMGPSLNYWLRDRGTQKGEIDFIIQVGSSIVPIEVKSEQGGKLKSLFYFAADKHWNFAVKFGLAQLKIHRASHKIREKKVNLEYIDCPIYAVEFIDQLIEKYGLIKTPSGR